MTTEKENSGVEFSYFATSPRDDIVSSNDEVFNQINSESFENRALGCTQMELHFPDTVPDVLEDERNTYSSCTQMGSHFPDTVPDVSEEERNTYSNYPWDNENTVFERNSVFRSFSCDANRHSDEDSDSESGSDTASRNLRSLAELECGWPSSSALDWDSSSVGSGAIGDDEEKEDEDELDPNNPLLGEEDEPFEGSLLGNHYLNKDFGSTDTLTEENVHRFAVRCDKWFQAPKVPIDQGDQSDTGDETDDTPRTLTPEPDPETGTHSGGAVYSLFNTGPNVLKNAGVHIPPAFSSPLKKNKTLTNIEKNIKDTNEDRQPCVSTAADLEAHWIAKSLSEKENGPVFDDSDLNWGTDSWFVDNKKETCNSANNVDVFKGFGGYRDCNSDSERSKSDNDSNDGSGGYNDYSGYFRQDAHRGRNDDGRGDHDSSDRQGRYNNRSEAGGPRAYVERDGYSSHTEQQAGVYVDHSGSNESSRFSGHGEEGDNGGQGGYGGRNEQLNNSAHGGRNEQLSNSGHGVQDGHDVYGGGYNNNSYNSDYNSGYSGYNSCSGYGRYNGGESTNYDWSSLGAGAGYNAPNLYAPNDVSGSSYLNCWNNYVAPAQFINNVQQLQPQSYFQQLHQQQYRQQEQQQQQQRRQHQQFQQQQQHQHQQQRNQSPQEQLEESLGHMTINAPPSLPMQVNMGLPMNITIPIASDSLPYNMYNNNMHQFFDHQRFMPTTNPYLPVHNQQSVSYSSHMYNSAVPTFGSSDNPENVGGLGRQYMVDTTVPPPGLTLNTIQMPVIDSTVPFSIPPSSNTSDTSSSGIDFTIPSDSQSSLPSETVPTTGSISPANTLNVSNAIDTAYPPTRTSPIFGSVAHLSMPPPQIISSEFFQQQRLLLDKLDGNLSNVDDYSGMMTTREQFWLSGIALMPIHNMNPSRDDYYFTRYQARRVGGKKGKNQPHSIEDRNSQNRVPDNGRSSSEQSILNSSPNGGQTLQTLFKNSLGILQHIGTEAPRKSLTTYYIESSEEDSEIDNSEYSKFKQVSFQTEELLQTIVSIQIIEMKLLDSKNHSENMDELRNERSQLYELIYDQLTSLLRSDFKSVYSMDKGKALIQRFFSLGENPRDLWFTFLENLGLILTDSCSEPFLMGLLSHFRVWISSSGESDIIAVSQYLQRDLPLYTESCFCMTIVSILIDCVEKNSAAWADDRWIDFLWQVGDYLRRHHIFPQIDATHVPSTFPVNSHIYRCRRLAKHGVGSLLIKAFIRNPVRALQEMEDELQSQEGQKQTEGENPFQACMRMGLFSFVYRLGDENYRFPVSDK